MKTRLLLPSLALLIAAAPSGRAAGPEDAVVKVVSTVQLPNPARPWARQNSGEICGSGVVIDGHRILTNAHLVTWAGDITVQAPQGGDRLEARVVAFAPGIDLAILTIPSEGEAKRLFADRPPPPWATSLPPVMAGVTIYGFPIGGNGLAVTRGTVARVEYDAYDALTAGLRIQINATLNAGNSGGPALVDGRMVGLVFGQHEEGQGIGYLIPVEEIAAFLADVADGRYDGKPRLIDEYQALENPALRDKLRLDRAVRGVMVRAPGRNDPAYPLREFDVITRIGDHAIDNEGMVQVRGDLRLSFEYLLPELARAGAVPLGLIRDGRELAVSLPVGREDDRLIRDLRGGYPRYVLIGPLLFSPAVAETVAWYLQANPTLIARKSPLLIRATDRVRFAGEELVVVTAPLFPHRITRGYGEPIGQVIETVNGVRIKNLRHLVEVIRDCTDEYLTFRFFEDEAETLIFRRRELLAATAEVMAGVGIPRRCSDDLLGVWDGKDAPPR